jgi:hypothetical protein
MVLEHFDRGDERRGRDFLAPAWAAIIAFASPVSLPTIACACSRQKAQPPSRVSLLEPGEM